MTIEIKKFHLIRQIMNTEDEALINKIQEIVGEQPQEDKNQILRKLSSPIKKKLDIEQVKIEQNFQPIDKEEINQLIKEADIQEPIEELLEMI